MEINDGLPSTVMPPIAVTLTFDHFIRKPNRYISRPKYMWPDFSEISSNCYDDICIHPAFGVIASCDLDLWPFNSKI